MKPKFKMLWQTMAIPVPVAVCTSITVAIARGNGWPMAIRGALVALVAVLVAVFCASLVIYAYELRRARKVSEK